MSSRHPATLSLSLEKFARHGGLSAPNSDGWGIAYYASRDVRLLREPEPAASSAFVRFIEHQAVRSRIAISHIRHATTGSVCLENTQPFRRELGGRMHVFAHNGAFPEIFDHDGFRASRYHPVGNTDSESAFCCLMTRLADIWDDACTEPSLAKRIQVVSGFASDLRALGAANFLYSDGEVLFAHAHKRRIPGSERYAPPGLHLLSRACNIEPSAFGVEGLHLESHDLNQEVVLLASVPLSEEPWEPLSEGELVVLSAGSVIERVSA